MLISEHILDTFEE